MCVVPGGDGGQPGCPGLAGRLDSSPRDDACTVGDDALAGEPEALGLNHQGAGPGSALSASPDGDGLVQLWPSGTLDLTPGHRGLLLPSGAQPAPSL